MNTITNETLKGGEKTPAQTNTSGEVVAKTDSNGKPKEVAKPGNPARQSKD